LDKERAQSSGNNCGKNLTLHGFL